jgi:ER-bound oxygenase mpaB/B'/Rubber oxygenase, catalytic domain
MPANTPPVPGTRFTVDWLNELATCGDVAADKVIEGLAKRRSTTDVERQNEFPDLTRRIWADVDLLEPPIRDFVMAGNEVAPHIETDKVTHAQAFFEEHGVAVITALFYAALPEAYLGQRGVQVLDLTGQLVRNWARRIQETGQFLLNVLTPAPWLGDKTTSLSPGEAGARAVRRVRLTHAAVRWLLDAELTTPFALLKREDLDTKSVWAARMVDVGEEVKVGRKHVVTSRPLNQQDLLATLGTFTTVTLDALAKLGVSFDDDDRVAYHHLWDVVAWHLGIGDAASVAEPGAPAPHAWTANRVLPLGVDEMDALYGWLSTELQHPTSQGWRLAKTLVQELALPLPRPLEGMPAVVVRYLIGDEKADWLQVERGGFTELLAVRTGRLEELVRRGSRVPGGPMLMSLAGTTLTRYALREFVARSRGSERGLRLDPTIAARWGVQVGPEVAPTGRA